MSRSIMVKRSTEDFDQDIPPGTGTSSLLRLETHSLTESDQVDKHSKLVNAAPITFTEVDSKGGMFFGSKTPSNRKIRNQFSSRMVT